MSFIAKFIRFADSDGQIYYGSPHSDLSVDLIGTIATILSGDPYSGFSLTESTAVIHKVLCPLETTPGIICIGLNYEFHTLEVNLPIPKYPTIITKPTDALAGPNDDIFIHPSAQSQLDYEGEICLIISRDGKNIPAAVAHEYILGYTGGNDLSARNFQMPAADVGGQFCYAKSFDGFAPIGPAVVLLNGDDLGGLEVGARGIDFDVKVGGEVRQEGRTRDMVFGVRELVEFLARGRTLRKGTVVMTGTPLGVGMFRNPPVYLADQDLVEVRVYGAGCLRNKIVFE